MNVIASSNYPLTTGLVYIPRYTSRTANQRNQIGGIEGLAGLDYCMHFVAEFNSVWLWIDECSIYLSVGWTLC
jgi:hypothetical protein